MNGKKLEWENYGTHSFLCPLCRHKKEAVHWWKDSVPERLGVCSLTSGSGIGHLELNV